MKKGMIKKEEGKKQMMLQAEVKLEVMETVYVIKLIKLKLKQDKL